MTTSIFSGPSFPRSCFDFLEIWEDAEALSKLCKKYEKVGLSETLFLEECLSVGDYVPVLARVWSEKSLDKRLTWLRAHQTQLHGLFLFELAVAEYENQPRYKELFRKTIIPLCRMASFRLEQDSTCFTEEKYLVTCISQKMKALSLQWFLKGKDVGSTSLMTLRINRVEAIYATRMGRVIEKTSPFPAIANEISEYYHRCISEGLDDPVISQDMIFDSMCLNTAGKLPHPHWMGWEGWGVRSSGNLGILPEEQHQQLREAYALKKIDLLSLRLRQNPGKQH